MKKTYAKIIKTGSFISSRIIRNKAFLNSEFFDEKGQRILKLNQEIINNLEKITGIKERRYAWPGQVTSVMACRAAEKALCYVPIIDKETLDYIIVAHNFGDNFFVTGRCDLVPSIAAKVKERLRIKNPNTVAFDMLFGCPGWLQGMIIADSLIKTGAKRIMVIGSENLSRVCDPHDRDSMIYADGAGATILESIRSETPVGIIAHATRSDTLNHAKLLFMGKSNNPEYATPDTFLKMDGSAVYEYALNYVPVAIKACLDQAGIPLEKVTKLLIHQANQKMDEKILQGLFNLYGKKRGDIPADIMPMTIQELGNSSVATIPTLLDLLLKKELLDHEVHSGDILLFASVGAGMNINAMVYKMP